MSSARYYEAESRRLIRELLGFWDMKTRHKIAVLKRVNKHILETILELEEAEAE